MWKRLAEELQELEAEIGEWANESWRALKKAATLCKKKTTEL